MILILFCALIVIGVLSLIKTNEYEDDLLTTLKYLGTELLLIFVTVLIYDLTYDIFRMFDWSESSYSASDIALIIPIIFFIATHLALRPKVRYFYISGSIAVIILSTTLSAPAGNLYAIALLILPMIPVALLLQRSGDFYQTFYLAVVKIWSYISGLISLWVGWTDDYARGGNILAGMVLQCGVFVISVIMYFIHTILDKRGELTNGHRRLCFVMGCMMIVVMAASIVGGIVQNARYETTDGTVSLESHPDHEPGAAEESIWVNFTSADGKLHEKMNFSTPAINDVLHCYKAGETVKLVYLKKPKYDCYTYADVRLYIPFYAIAVVFALTSAFFFWFYTKLADNAYKRDKRKARSE